MRIAFLGAGSIGCFIGGCWQLSGLDICLLGRESTGSEIATNGLTLTDHLGWRKEIGSTEVEYTTNPGVLSGADLIAITVKSMATREAAALIELQSQPGTPILSLQNGISNVELLREKLPGHPIYAGMVPYNVVRLGDGRWHKASSGEIVCQEGPVTSGLAEKTTDSPAALSTVDDMVPVAWGKLVLNLNNAINALSGLTLVEQLSDRSFRKVLAASIREAMAVLASAQIVPTKVAALPPQYLARFIDTPDWFFKSIGLRLQKIDANARSSMADDFAANRPTEIDFLNGEVCRLAAEHVVDTPVNNRIVELIRSAEAGGRRNWTGPELLTALELPG